MTMRMPRWYVRWCEVQSRAVWRGLITEQEASRGLRVMHAVALREAWAVAE